MRCIIQIDETCFVAGWPQGNPPRTTKIEFAQQFNSDKEANKRINEIKASDPLKMHKYKILNF
ncbi:hypothetical protein [Tenacibaculum sp. C7A-26P2]|uniref:hypothetical protein n=1 Tax=Tenacibaculum sp. C7A-26P2 TaxID=3447504 RepID=UPI003F86DE1D